MPPKNEYSNILLKWTRSNCSLSMVSLSSEDSKHLNSEVHRMMNVLGSVISDP